MENIFLLTWTGLNQFLLKFSRFYKFSAFLNDLLFQMNRSLALYLNSLSIYPLLKEYTPNKYTHQCRKPKGVQHLHEKIFWICMELLPRDSWVVLTAMILQKTRYFNCFFRIFPSILLLMFEAYIVQSGIYPKCQLP